ncbi:FAD/NAD(P)-binding domain-containing protein [Annulohypoxylon truncatum]|uniref:FAD/NAD(P)-binding domain-containing protein n=1 Tax=Annulohypoxylon truncatum TaxID=327061 RepID=UPI0020085574|nr:FAD/NAD(P)-binding domain-containing protein [Annulohypoxylon truncatum]KAI1208162.1 FAD/NAD(P)-binding domain-containing protein [Annulohypoxylon truncatum]
MPSGKESSTRPRHIAIVGGGISGIACSWKLRKHGYLVDIYESDSKLGGHANSVAFKGKGRVVDVDTGFIALDEATYPQFNDFLKELGIRTIPTDMSFGVSVSDGDFEWSSSSIWSFLGELSYLFTFWFWRLVFEILWFSLFAHEILYEEPTIVREDEDTSLLTSCENEIDAIEKDLKSLDQFQTIGDYLKEKKYSDEFINYFLIPMVASPWCIDTNEFKETFPARPLIRFMMDHRLLDTVTRTLRWRSFQNGSKTYVDAFLSSLPAHHQVHLKTPVQKAVRLKQGVMLTFGDGSSRIYDHVALAVHARQALDILGNGATDLERRILSSFQTSRNTCYLHSDTSFLPKRPSARAAWNCFLGRTDEAIDGTPPHEQGSKISITFDMNKLQGIPFPGDPNSVGRVLVSMNPTRIPKTLQSIQVYHHPLISSESILMSGYIHRINGVSGISFAGAWMGFGFHEDGFASGAHVACMLVDGREKAGYLDLVASRSDSQRRKFGPGESLLRAVLVLARRSFLLLRGEGLGSKGFI